jgi:nifR3 family TIM-barrel protein
MNNPFPAEQPVLLAPMAGYTDVVFRALCTSFGCDLTYTEMVSAKGLTFGNEKTSDYLSLEEDEVAVGVQLFGHEPDRMADAAKIVSDRLGPRLRCIDLNMGCPAQKIVSNGDGSALMKTPALAGAIVDAVKKASPVPVTVKFRKGWDGDTCVSFAKILEDSGADAICLHPRTRVQQYEGKADRPAIGAVKAAVRIPVIGNGDVDSGESAVSMIRETGCDGVMIGRGALGRPWIFAEVKAALSGAPYTAPDVSGRLMIALRHAERIESVKGPHGLVELRKHLPRYLHGIRGAAALRTRLNDAKTAAEIREFLLDSLNGGTI